jgi:hypothetical protein
MNSTTQELNPPPTGGFPIAWGQDPEPTPYLQRNLDTDLEALKTRLLQQALGNSVTTTLAKPLRRAANEAAAIAWLEPLPLLVFPTLFEEKVRSARKQALRQELVQARSSEWLQEVA